MQRAAAAAAPLNRPAPSFYAIMLMSPACLPPFHYRLEFVSFILHRCLSLPGFFWQRFLPHRGICRRNPSDKRAETVLRAAARISASRLLQYLQFTVSKAE